MRRSFLVFFLITGLAAYAAADCGEWEVGIPDLNQSVLAWGLAAGESATLLVLPDGRGAPLTAARRANGALVDATLTLTIIDGCGYPVSGFPAADMWLESSGGTFTACAGGSTADRNTDTSGQAVWAQPLLAGGNSQGPCMVLINGMPVNAALPLSLHFNSPDLNGDLTVSLIDVAAFAAGYFGDYLFAADLQADGVVNLADLSALVGGLGAVCH